MDKIVAVRLKYTNKAELFDSAGVQFQPTDWVVVQSPRGPELGHVALPPRDPSAQEQGMSFPSVLRVARPEDHQQYQKLEGQAAEALARCREEAKRLNLPMKVISAHFTLDSNHLTVYFVAEERVDFRDLVRELRHTLKTRVELRQVGPRDEAKLIGALGKCGRALCCMTWIDEFTPISIRMAKDQDLSLSPMKVSGICGRLLCCLSYEADYYRSIREHSPRVGQEASYPQGKGRVLSVNSLKETALLETGTDQTVEVPIAQLTWERRPKAPPKEEPPKRKEGDRGGGKGLGAARHEPVKGPETQEAPLVAPPTAAAGDGGDKGSPG